ncbi:hypothetical protein N7534_010948 [Penicillium rubens]|nr:hypothetical protein N7534_010948 [Penicillium rubens]
MIIRDKNRAKIGYTFVAYTKSSSLKSTREIIFYPFPTETSYPIKSSYLNESYRTEYFRPTEPYQSIESTEIIEI